MGVWSKDELRAKYMAAFDPAAADRVQQPVKGPVVLVDHSNHKNNGRLRRVEEHVGTSSKNIAAMRGDWMSLRSLALGCYLKRGRARLVVYLHGLRRKASVSWAGLPS